MNRTLLDKVRCMMISSSIPKSFWGEAVVTACYLVNITPSIALNGPDLEKIGEDQKVGDSRQLETIKVSAYIPSTSSEVDVQQPERDDICETVVEEYLDKRDSLRDYQLTRDRVRRPHREPHKFGYESEVAFAYASFEKLVDMEPRSYQEAFKSEQSNEWLETMKEEMSSLEKNQTWDLVPRPKNKSLVGYQSPVCDEDVEYMNRIPYSNAIGSIMYLMVCTRPDLTYDVSTRSRFMSNQGLDHWKALKWVPRYLRGSSDTGLVFKNKSKGVMLKGFVDADYAGDTDNRKSTTSYVFTLCDSCMNWKSQLQHIVALSTTESEYIALTKAVKESL
ncbi:Uncharacterized protein Adt_13474 [Abeliophyllum distichum]|uniref:Retrovirus-related Pol polyprotein from transposon TNT 1-94 n=1 Tax=Abeliophyllum distichum TaxID=126358 RepID=A0ABD1TWW4_9LAMI